MANYIEFSDGLKTGNPVTDQFVHGEQVIPPAPAEAGPGPAPESASDSGTQKKGASPVARPRPASTAVERAAPPETTAQPRATPEPVADEQVTPAAPRRRRGRPPLPGGPGPRRPARRIREQPCRVELHIDGSAYSVDLPASRIDEGLATLRVIDILGLAERRLDGAHRRPPTQISELHNRARQWAHQVGREVGNRGPVSWALVKDYLRSRVAESAETTGPGGSPAAQSA